MYLTGKVLEKNCSSEIECWHWQLPKEKSLEEIFFSTKCQCLKINESEMLIVGNKKWFIESRELEGGRDEKNKGIHSTPSTSSYLSHKSQMFILTHLYEQTHKLACFRIHKF
jgi:hypothetical protein